MALNKETRVGAVIIGSEKDGPANCVALIGTNISECAILELGSHPASTAAKRRGQALLNTN